MRWIRFAIVASCDRQFARRVAELESKAGLCTRLRYPKGYLTAER